MARAAQFTATYRDEAPIAARAQLHYALGLRNADYIALCEQVCAIVGGDAQPAFRLEQTPVSKYYFRLEGPARERRMAEYDSLGDARNEAVRFLGSYLAEHPGFAEEGHWRVNVEDAAGRPYLHVIVATVTAKEAPPGAA